MFTSHILWGQECFLRSLTWDNRQLNVRDRRRRRHSVTGQRRQQQHSAIITHHNIRWCISGHSGPHSDVNNMLTTRILIGLMTKHWSLYWKDSFLLVNGNWIKILRIRNLLNFFTKVLQTCRWQDSKNPIGTPFGTLYWKWQFNLVARVYLC